MRVALPSLFLLLAQPAYSQPVPSENASQSVRPQEADLVVTVGVAPVMSPSWQGSKDFSLSLFPDLRINYRDVFFASVPEGMGFNVLNRDGWRVGPLAKLRFGRDEDNGGSPFLIAGGSKALLGMGDVKAAVEAGAFVEKSFGARRGWRVRADIRRGFGGHEGMIADVAINYRTRLGRASISVGPRATIADARFMRTYFGIGLTQASRTGLAQYDAGGGLLTYGVGATVIRPLDRRSALTLFSSIERLGAPAADSPLVRDRGQPTQLTLGVGYGLRFGL